MMCSSLWRGRALVAVMGVLAAAVCGCGASRSGHDSGSRHASVSVALVGDVKPLVGGVPSSGGVVALVGNVVISKAAFEARMLGEEKNNGPPYVPLDAPTFHRCLAILVALAAKSTSGPRPGTTELKAGCAHRYEEISHRVLESMISSLWTIGGAKEEGLEVDDATLRAQLARSLARRYHSAAALDRFLRSSGESVSDLLFGLKAQALGEMIRHRAYASVGVVTRARIAHYYASHPEQFVIPESRDLGLIHAKSKAMAERVKRELESGVSFQRIAKRLSGEQSPYALKGLVKGLTEHFFRQEALNDAIFAARPHVVTGPVEVNLSAGLFGDPGTIASVNGYYVLKIENVQRPREKPLSAVEHELLLHLPSQLHAEALTTYIKAWRARWKARTDCRPGFVVRQCRQFVPVAGEPAEDAYTLN